MTLVSDDWASARTDGRIANLDVIAQVRTSTIDGGAGHGMRSIDVRLRGLRWTPITRAATDAAPSLPNRPH